MGARYGSRPTTCSRRRIASAHPSSPHALDAYAAHGAFTAGGYEAMLDPALAAEATADEHGRVAIHRAVDTRTVDELNARARADRILT